MFGPGNHRSDLPNVSHELTFKLVHAIGDDQIIEIYWISQSDDCTETDILQSETRFTTKPIQNRPFEVDLPKVIVSTI